LLKKLSFLKKILFFSISELTALEAILAKLSPNETAHRWVMVGIIKNRRHGNAR
jgi:hypothetical protein